MQKKLFAIICLSLSLSVSAGGHKERKHMSSFSLPSDIPSGAFTTLNISAKNPKAYTDYIASNPALFETIGSIAAGVCVTQTGQDYPGQMFVWNAFDSVKSAMEGLTKYDPAMAPKKLSAMRDIKTSAIWKPLKKFDVAPGYERVTRVMVRPGRLSAFVAAATQMENEAQAAGLNVQIGVFAPIGGGREETGTLTVRFVQPSASEMGQGLDNFFSSEISPESGFAKMISMMRPINDTIEVCQQIYSAS
tara:strand:+ start:11690 stop:12433 length:744 start_codon:yes stop_codon:yes gene_type:complete